jgi:dCTP deaminase/dUTP pyrophosphatase
MPLGIDRLHELIKEKKLVEGLSERELNNPEGTGIEVRIGKVYRIKGRGFLGVDERETPKAELVAEMGKDKNYVLKPGEFIIVETIERVNMPDDIQGMIAPRSTLCRSGIQLLFSQIDPGYTGTISLGLKNLSDEAFTFELGARAAKFFFFTVEGKAHSYRGQWKGGRVSTDGREKQV